MEEKQIALNNRNKEEFIEENNKELLELIENNILENKENQLAEATVLEVGEKTVLLNIKLKSDGIISLNEFKDSPNLKVGDSVEIYIENQEDKHDQLIISRKKAKQLRGWQIIEEAYQDKKTLLGTIEKRVKGGLEVKINNVTVFLPGSQIDTSPVADFDSLLNKSIEVAVLSIKPEKQNAVVSRRALLELDQKALIENLEEGQVLEGTVKNITDFGVFVQLAPSIVGLVHVKEMVWGKKIEHPSEVKNSEGDNFFVENMSIKVAVKGFEAQAGSNLPRIALSTKALEPNPWDKLTETMEIGTILTGKVTQIKEKSICVQVQEGIEGFVHISEMSHSSYIHSPEEIVKLGDEIELEIVKLDPEKQDLRLSMKNLMASPWEVEDFQEKYGLNTRHKAIVRRFAPKNKGTFLELLPGIEGYLENDHISWTQTILRASEYFEVDQAVEVIILSVDDENKLLKLGMRELEDSPWDTFEKKFTVGSQHEGLIKNKYRTGVIIELPYGLQAFVPNKELIKEDKSIPEEGETLEFKIQDFIKYEHKIMLSHTETFKESEKIESNSYKEERRESQPAFQKATLSDLSTFTKLKEKITKNKKVKEIEVKEENKD